MHTLLMRERPPSARHVLFEGVSRSQGKPEVALQSVCHALRTTKRPSFQLKALLTIQDAGELARKAVCFLVQGFKKVENVEVSYLRGTDDSADRRIPFQPGSLSRICLHF